MSTVIVDIDRLDANLRRFQTLADAAGCRVRAHFKAHRTVEIAVRQVTEGAVGAAVHTAHAARRLAAAGIPDAVIAWPWADPWRFDHYAEAALTVPRFAVHVAAADVITGVAAAAERRGVEIGVRIDLRHTPADEVVTLAELAVRTTGVRLDGVTGYSAPATQADLDGRHELGRRHAREVVAAAEAIRSHGLECPVVSVGGTPTAAAASAIPGVTELCVGAYATYDGGLATAGVCRPEQVAVSVATDAAEILAECGQPWAPGVTSLPGAPPYQDRLVPAHICPLAATLARTGRVVTAVAGGRPVGRWTPLAAPDRA